jgi:oligopeptide transport system ATP-binding protein
MAAEPAGHLESLEPLASGAPLLRVQDLRVRFATGDGLVQAVAGVDLRLARGETLGLVGESGSGKSVLSLALLGLVPQGQVTGQIWFRGEELLAMSPARLRRLRGDRIAMIFQDPMTALNPYLRIGTQITEVLRLHQGLGRRAARERAIELLRDAGIAAPERRIDQYPHQFSGGMRQRALIAQGLACGPELLIADEPTSALDVTIQAQILDLIRLRTRSLGTAVILITHDLGVVAAACDTLAVMYAGRIVERGPTGPVFQAPRHPYTQGLIRSVPRLDRPGAERLVAIPGQPPSGIGLPPCCPFHPRCAQVLPICRQALPPEVDLGGGHGVACWLYPEPR